MKSTKETVSLHVTPVTWSAELNGWMPGFPALVTHSGAENMYMSEASTLQVKDWSDLMFLSVNGEELCFQPVSQFSRGGDLLWQDYKGVGHPAKLRVFAD